MAVEVVDNPDKSRFEIHVDGALAGFADYKLLPARIKFTHTEVEPAYEGQGWRPSWSGSPSTRAVTPGWPWCPSAPT